MTSQVASKGTAIESSQDFAHAIDLLGVHDFSAPSKSRRPAAHRRQDADYMRGALSAAGDITVNAVVLRSKGGDDTAEALLLSMTVSTTLTSSRPARRRTRHSSAT